MKSYKKILLTAAATLMLGANAYLAKPFTAEALVALVRELAAEGGEA